MFGLMIYKNDVFLTVCEENIFFFPRWPTTFLCQTARPTNTCQERALLGSGAEMHIKVTLHPDDLDRPKIINF